MTKESITQKELRRLIDYNPETGAFTWKVSQSSRAIIGEEAGWIWSGKDGKKYRRIRLNKKDYAVHRLIFLWMTGIFPPELVDHANGCGTDNRWINIKCVSAVENNKNMRKRKDNKTGCTGVTWYPSKNKWYSRITLEGKNHNLGCFVTKEKAIEARKIAEQEYGFHANHGTERSL